MKETLFTLLIGCLFLSCTTEKKPTRQELISQRLQLKRLQYLDRLHDNCFEALKDSAEHLALERIKKDFAFLNDTTFGVPIFPAKPDLKKLYNNTAELGNTPLFDTIPEPPKGH